MCDFVDILIFLVIFFAWHSRHLLPKLVGCSQFREKKAGFGGAVPQVFPRKTENHWMKEG